jgi:hypothetical protein
VRRSFDRLDEAKGWRADASVGLRKGTMCPPARITLNEAADAWLEGAKAGTIRNRSGDAYKPSVIWGYESALTRKIRPPLGAHRLSDVRRVDVQDLADRMLADGDDPSTIRNALMPLRAIYGGPPRGERWPSTRRSVSSSRQFEADEIALHRLAKPRTSSRRHPPRIVLYGRPPCTPASGAAN